MALKDEKEREIIGDIEVQFIIESVTTSEAWPSLELCESVVEDTGTLGPEEHLEGVTDPGIVHHVGGDGSTVSILQALTALSQFIHVVFVASL